MPWLPLLLGEFVATDPTPEQDWQQVRAAASTMVSSLLGRITDWVRVAVRVEAGGQTWNHCLTGLVRNPHLTFSVMSGRVITPQPSWCRLHPDPIKSLCEMLTSADCICILLHCHLASCHTIFAHRMWASSIQHEVPD